MTAGRTWPTIIDSIGNMTPLDGNIALTGGLDLSKGSKFTIALAFGTTRHDALSTLAQSLSIPF